MARARTAPPPPPWTDAERWGLEEREGGEVEAEAEAEAEPSHRRRRIAGNQPEPTEQGTTTTDAKTPDGVDGFPPSLPLPSLLEIRAQPLSSRRPPASLSPGLQAADEHAGAAQVRPPPHGAI